MSSFSTGYEQMNDDESDLEGQRILNGERGGEDEGAPHVVGESHSRTPYNHIENLDDFFKRVYEYFRRGGFSVILQEECMLWLQFLFVLLIVPGFLVDCVDYDKLFDNEDLVGDHVVHKYHLADVIITPCRLGFGHPFMTVYNVGVLLFLLALVIKTMYNVSKYREIKHFYNSALDIEDRLLSDMRWCDILPRILDAQKEHQMCIHVAELSELDISNRILRFKNYFVAMVNKSLLPFKFTLPLLGERTFLSHGLKYNLELLLFWGPGSPFQNNWHLKKQYKAMARRSTLAQEMSKRIFWLGLANLFLSPIILLWQLIYFFFVYAEMFKRDPSSLGKKQWSLYSRSYLRHFNELDHELDRRLEIAHPLAMSYLQGFKNRTTSLVARYVSFFIGSVLAILICLTLYDEDTINVGGMLQVFAILGTVLGIARSFIPEENKVFEPTVIMTQIIGQIHYFPDSWRKKLHTSKVQGEFGQLFQSKLVFVIEELFSPLITPFVLLFCVRPRSLEIVDFFRHFTIDVVGVGDVCSFAQLDIRRHGNQKWVPAGESNADRHTQSEEGKTELSLLRFKLNNPAWQPPEAGSAFLTSVKEHALKDAISHEESSEAALHSGVISMFGSMRGGVGQVNNSLSASMFGGGAGNHRAPRGGPGRDDRRQYHDRQRMRSEDLRGGATSAAGLSGARRYMSGSSVGQSGVGSVGILRSLAEAGSLYEIAPELQSLVDSRTVDLDNAEMEMSYSTVYLHELRQRHGDGQGLARMGYDRLEEEGAGAGHLEGRGVTDEPTSGGGAAREYGAVGGDGGMGRSSVREISSMSGSDRIASVVGDRRGSGGGGSTPRRAPLLPVSSEDGDRLHSNSEEELNFNLGQPPDFDGGPKPV